MAQAVVASFAFLVSFAAFGQSPRFEVASVKPVGADRSNGSSGITTGHGRIKADNVTLKRCIMGAFGIGPHQIAGGPPWLDTDRFEIVAKAEQPVNDDAALMLMLRTLLAERFGLRFHRETRRVAALILEVASHGPKLEPAKDGEAASTTADGRGSLNAKAITMARFAEVLSRQMDLPVVDATGLKGAFDLQLSWKPESEGGPSIFIALPEQLGLRLQSRKTPLEILVIDRAEKPSEN